jgi:hypothetical protein
MRNPLIKSRSAAVGCGLAGLAVAGALFLLPVAEVRADVTPVNCSGYSFDYEDGDRTCVSPPDPVSLQLPAGSGDTADGRAGGVPGVNIAGAYPGTAPVAGTNAAVEHQVSPGFAGTTPASKE